MNTHIYKFLGYSLHTSHCHPPLAHHLFFFFFVCFCFLLFIFFNLHPILLAYSAIMISEVESNGSSPMYNTQCSSQQVSSLMPLTHLAHPPSHTPSSNPQFVLHIYESLLFCLPPCFYIIFVSLPLRSSVLSLKVLI